jgi:hypothetical protein
VILDWKEFVFTYFKQNLKPGPMSLKFLAIYSIEKLAVLCTGKPRDALQVVSSLANKY